MKKFAFILTLVIVGASSLTSCCKVCKKEGQNNVQVCRDNYSSESDYNSAIGAYQLVGYSCN